MEPIRRARGALQRTPPGLAFVAGSLLRRLALSATIRRCRLRFRGDACAVAADNRHTGRPRWRLQLVSAAVVEVLGVRHDPAKLIDARPVPSSDTGRPRQRLPAAAAVGVDRGRRSPRCFPHHPSKTVSRTAYPSLRHRASGQRLPAAAAVGVGRRRRNPRSVTNHPVGVIHARPVRLDTEPPAGGCQRQPQLVLAAVVEILSVSPHHPAALIHARPVGCVLGASAGGCQRQPRLRSPRRCGCPRRARRHDPVKLIGARPVVS